jgi:hypothetical protein
MRESATRQTTRYGRAGAGTEKLIRQPPGTASTEWVVLGIESTDQAQECGGSQLVMRNGSQIPAGVRRRPRIPTLSVSSAGSTADTLGPHRGQLPVREISAHASSAVAVTNRRAVSVTPAPGRGCSRPRSRGTPAGESDGVHVNAVCHGRGPRVRCRAYPGSPCPVHSSPEPPVT